MLLALSPKWLLSVASIVISFVMLSGCAPTVMYKSSPPGAVITGQRLDGGTFVFNTPAQINYPTLNLKNGGCDEVFTPTARWPDGVTLDPIRLRVCLQSSEWTLVKPAVNNVLPQSRNQAPSPQTNSSMGIDEAKLKCAQLGFKVGTETFGNCVLRLTK